MANREILINLLKDLLDKNLCVIEKRNTNEIKDLSLLSTTVTTIQKNIKSCETMTNKIIEKMKQKEEEERKKKEETKHKRSQSQGGMNKAGTAKKILQRNKTEANLKSKPTEKTLRPNKSMGTFLRSADKMAKSNNNKTIPGSTTKTSHNLKPLSLTESKSSRDFNKTTGDNTKKMTKNATSTNLTEPGHKRTKSEGVNGGKEKTLKRELTKPKLTDKKTNKTDTKDDKKDKEHKKENTKKKDISKNDKQKDNQKKTEHKKEEPKKEEPKKEEPKKEETKKEETKKEEPKKEETKKVEPIKEETKKEEPPKPKIKKDEVISKNIKRISEFLQLKEQYALSKLSKKTIIAFFEIMKSKYDTAISPIQKEIDSLLEKHSKEELEKEPKPFTIGKGALKAIGMLNGKNYLSKFESTPTPPEDIILIYRLFVQLLRQKHKDLVLEKDNDKFWNKLSVYFIQNSNEELGKLIEVEFKDIDLTDENISIIIDMCKPYQSILTPTYYSKNCPTTGLFVFLIKETLEYIGAINEKKTQPSRLYMNYQYKINIVKGKQEKINEFIEKLKK